MRRRVSVVVNPASGGGRGERQLDPVIRALTTDGHDVQVARTRSLDHAEQLAGRAVADDRLVAAMGGDGLVGRVAGTVAAAGGVLAVLPAGRGNDFARAVGLPRRAPAACAVVTTGREHAVDIGVVRCSEGGTHFLGIASVGIDSDAQELVLRSRLPLGRLVYAAAAVRAVAGFRPATFRTHVDGEPLPVRGWSVAVANSGWYGAGMHLVPGASVDDGRLDVLTVGAISRAGFLRVLPQVFTGGHLSHPAVTVRPATVVQLSADRPFRAFADGEPVGALPCTVTVLPGALRLLLPG